MKEKDALDVQDTKFKFLENEVGFTITRLNEVFNIDDAEWVAQSDENISMRKSEISEHLKELPSLSTSIKDLMGSASGLKGAHGMIYTQQER